MRFLAALTCAALGGCATAHARPPAILPLKSLRLYETGVGYFERSGVLAAAGTALPVPTGHLDDALKSLVVLGGGARLFGLEFGGGASHGMARALAGLPQSSAGAITYDDLLASLKGAELTLRLAKESLVGRLVDVVGKGGDATLLVLARDGAIRRVPVAEVRSTRPNEARLVARLESALDALSPRGAQAARSVKVLAESGGAPVTLGYVAETPVWRTTYRMVLGGARDHLLQAWALIHNDTDENWSNVHIQLINGRPDSFLYPLAAPRYLRRELVHPDERLSTVPQLLDTTVDTLWGDNLDGADALESLSASGYGSGGGGGAGYGLGSIGTVGHGSGSGESSLLSVGNLAAVAPAAGLESGALFSYALPDALALRAHGSALVPFLQERVDAERMTIFHAPAEAGRAAARIANSTRQTLPAGTIAFFDAGGFAGEAGLDRLKPGERCFVEYGADLDVELSAKVTSTSERVQRLAFTGDALVEHFLLHTETRYELSNRGGQPRTVTIELKLVKNAKVRGADALDYDSKSGRPLALFHVAAQKEVARELVSDEGRSRSAALASLTARRLDELGRGDELPAADRACAAAAAVALAELEAAGKRTQKLNEERVQLEADLARLREHLKALAGDKGSTKATDAFVQRILAAEDKLGRVRLALDGLAADVNRHQAALKRALEPLPRG